MLIDKSDLNIDKVDGLWCIRGARKMMDLVLNNCRIYGKHESDDTIGIRDGKITYVGNADIREGKRSIDLEGKTVLPGFIDSHTHLLNLGLSLVRLDLSSSRTRAEALDKATEYASNSVSKVSVGYGWDETVWGEKEYISRKELDKIETPIVLYRKDMHMAVLNSSALALAGIESYDGTVKEEKLRLLDPITEPDQEETGRAIQTAAGFAVSQGITTVRDVMGEKVKRAVEAGTIPLRVFQLIYDREYHDYPLNSALSWGIKMFLDGSIGARTAAHRGWDGANLKYTDEKLDATLLGYWRKGLPVAMHAIGDMAVDQAIMALRNQRGTLRNSIEHFELVNPELLNEIGNSTIVSSQPNFLQWSQKNGLYENTLGNEWVGKDNPFRKILDAGVHLAFGSDCMPMGPCYGIGLTVNSAHTDQRISLNEAVEAYTAGGAYVLGEEGTSGKIATGYRADLAVFDSDFLDFPKNVGQRKPLLTFVSGNEVYRKSESVQN